MSWAVVPSRSLFHYESSESASFYATQNQNYRPSFREPSAGLLEVDARQACGITIDSTDPTAWSTIQRTCYYDIAATGDVAFGRMSREAAEHQVELREAMRNSPKFNDALSLRQSVSIGQQVIISFRATSEFSSTIAYKLLRGPTGGLLNETTGEFQWTVTKDAATADRVPVQVSAQDATYKLTSTYEVTLEIQQKSSGCSVTFTSLLLLCALVSAIQLN